MNTYRDIAALAIARIKLRGISPPNPATESLIEFTKWTKPNYQPSKHHELTAEYLEKVERGEILRLIVLEPPQFGKSELTSKRFPAYAMCRRPTRRIITASYGDSLAVPFGRECRNIIASEECREIFPNVTIASDSKSASLWHTNHGGRLLSVGIGGGVTGHGADIFNIDDPVKSHEEAVSATFRKKIWNWYRTEAYTRVAPTGAIILTMTHWHEDDLAGRLLNATGGDKFELLKLPALAEKDDPLGRAVGEPLWPERYSLEWHHQTREVEGPTSWNALYQQNPTPETGNIFQWYETYTELPRFSEIMFCMDTAYTEETNSDWTAVSVWGLSPGHLDLIDADKWQLETPKAEAAMWKFWMRVRQRYPNISVVPCHRDRVAIDKITAQHLKAMRMPAVSVKMPSGRGDEPRIVSARLIVGLFESHIARIPSKQPPLFLGDSTEGPQKPWLDEWIKQHKEFPNGKHDDWVECTNIAGTRYQGSTVNWQKPGYVVKIA